MKFKNLEVGLSVQVKSKDHAGFYDCSTGKCGTIVEIDTDSVFDVRVRYDDGTFEWGNHKGIKQVNKGFGTLQDVKVGDRVEILDKRSTHFCDCYKGRIGIVTQLDPTCALDVKVEFDDGDIDWGNHKDIKRAPVESTETSEPANIEVGSRVRLKQDKVLGFLVGDVGTVKHIDSEGTVAVHFDVPRNGWGGPNNDFGIPNLHGLLVPPNDLEVITD